MPKPLHQSQAEELWNRGQALIAEGCFEDALLIAEQMQKDQDEAAFELCAQAYIGLGQLHDAIAALERGLRALPEAGLSWELLGTCYIDAQRFEDAECAFERALRCESTRRDSVRLNQAHLAQRRGDPETALWLAESVESPDLSLKKARIKARALLDRGEADAALDQCRSVGWPDDPNQSEREELIRLCLTHADVYATLGAPVEATSKLLKNALTAIPDSTLLLTRYRQFRNRMSSQPRLYSVVSDFELDPRSRIELRAVGFLRSGQAIADTPEEAIALFRELEDDRFLVFAEVPDVCELADRAEPPKGVTVRSPRIYYESRD